MNAKKALICRGYCNILDVIEGLKVCTNDKMNRVFLSKIVVQGVRVMLSVASVYLLYTINYLVRVM